MPYIKLQCSSVYRYNISLTDKTNVVCQCVWGAGIDLRRTHSSASTLPVIRPSARLFKWKASITNALLCYHNSQDYDMPKTEFNANHSLVVGANGLLPLENVSLFNYPTGFKSSARNTNTGSDDCNILVVSKQEGKFLVLTCQSQTCQALSLLSLSIWHQNDLPQHSPTDSHHLNGR